MKSGKVSSLQSHLADLKEKEVLDAVQYRLDRGDAPLTIIEDCQQAMVQVGRRYEKGVYFISGLIVAGELFREVTERVQPMIEKGMVGKKSGTILLGTVHGDIHDLGKNLFGLLMKCYGFTVHDIGVDLPAAVFRDKADELSPDIIGLSGLLTTAYEAMGNTVKLIKNSEDRRIAETPILIGGSMLKQKISDDVGADYWTTSAMDGVHLCRKIVADRPGWQFR